MVQFKKACPLGSSVRKSIWNRSGCILSSAWTRSGEVSFQRVPRMPLSTDASFARFIPRGENGVYRPVFLILIMRSLFPSAGSDEARTGRRPSRRCGAFES